jgi:uncharacterized protein
MATLFKRNRELELRIDDYLDLIVNGGLLFRQGLRLYLQDRHQEFEDRLSELRGVEQQADSLRRSIETSLYVHTLIPESRGDVLGLLESADRVLNRLTDTLLQFSIEMPEMLLELNDLFMDVAEAAIATSDSMVRAIRSYFRDLNAVRDHIGQVQFARQETNRLAERYKRTIFRQALRLSHKNQLRYFADHVENLADEAEDVSDRVSIAAIKRYV